MVKKKQKIPSLSDRERSELVSKAIYDRSCFHIVPSLQDKWSAAVYWHKSGQRALIDLDSGEILSFFKVDPAYKDKMVTQKVVDPYEYQELVDQRITELVK